MDAPLLEGVRFNDVMRGDALRSGDNCRVGGLGEGIMSFDERVLPSEAGISVVTGTDNEDNRFLGGDGFID